MIKTSGKFMSKKVKIGNVVVGGGERIAVQSMSTHKIKDIGLAAYDCERLAAVGCDILRFSVLDEEDAFAIKELKKRVNIPIVADIHFDYRLAIRAIESGADKIRINPGNIGSDENIEKVAAAIKERRIPVRVGSNTGSIEKEHLNKYGKSEVALGESALKNVSVLERFGVDDIVVSVKASDVPLTVKAYEYVAAKCDYPLHVGITEAGTEYNGVIKNAMGIGALLLKGIGDTIRVSLSADPEKEVKAARAILSGLDLINDCPKIIACPTCGRCAWDCMAFAKKTEDYVKNVRKPVKIAVMGCAVNGPGEAKDADIGVAGGKDGCVIFVKGEIYKRVKEDELEKAFFGEIDKCLL